MSKKDRKPFNQADYLPKRFGLRYTPPQIIIEYMTLSTGKLYHHKIRLHKFNVDSKLTDVMKDIYERHSPYLDNKKVNPNQILKLIEKIRSNLQLTKDKSLSRQSTAITKSDIKNVEIQSKQIHDEQQQVQEEEEDYNFDDLDDEDLNKLDTDALNAKKNQMDKFYDKNNIQVDDPNFVYDVRKDFNNNDQYGAEWDDDSY